MNNVLDSFALHEMAWLASNSFLFVNTHSTFLQFCGHSSLEGASDHLVSFVLSCLQEEKVADPEGMEQMLQDFLGNGKIENMH